MMHADDAALFTDVTAFALTVAKASPLAESTHETTQLSAMLFKRLAGHHRAYGTLADAGLWQDGDIILRAGLETAICVLANAASGDTFANKLRGDAIDTLQRQIARYRIDGDLIEIDRNEAAVAHLRDNFDRVKEERLNWSSLAKLSGAPHLYDWHRQLSSNSSHVTGLSIMRGVEGETTARSQARISEIERRNSPLMMMGATVQAGVAHAELLTLEGMVAAGGELADRLFELQRSWIAMLDGRSAG